MSNVTKKCPMCAEQIPLEATVCEYCGTKFEVTVEAGQSVSKILEEPIEPPKPPAQPVPTPSSAAAPKQSSPWVWVAAGLGLLLIVALGGGGILFAQNGMPFLATPTNTPRPTSTQRPTSAPTQTSKPTPLPMPAEEVSVYCGYFGDSPVYLDTGQPVILYWKWGAATDEYRQDYIAAASFALQLDGSFLDLSNAAQSLHTCEEGGLCVTWRLPPIMLERGNHKVIMTVTLARELTDGFDLDQNGELDIYDPGDWTAPLCEIIVQ